MCTLKITLKQHTPLIHFQHDQDGATLRASEVKPKLDKFIIKHAFHDNFDECKEYLVGYNPQKTNDLRKKWDAGCRALNYKLKIEVSKLSEKKEFLLASYLKKDKKKELENLGIDVISNTSFFAQEKENGKITGKKDWDRIGKKGLVWDDISLVFFSLNTTLITYLENNIANFFICTNFGTRSDKGFGSFTVLSINGKTDNIPNSEKGYKEAFRTFYKFCYRRKSSKSIYSDIKDDYQRLKSGTNFGNYRKSLLFCYAVDRMNSHPRWEKRHFKQMMYSQLRSVNSTLKANRNRNGNFNPPIADSNGAQNWRDTPNAFNYVYLRALLGLADHFEFQLKGDYERAVVSVDGGDINRFQSPLFFKVINDVIYLLGNEPKAILNKSFRFSYSVKDTDTELPLPIYEDQLSTPINFSLSDFVFYAVYEADNSLRLNYQKLF